MRKPTRRTFKDLADEFERIALAAKPRKRTTLIEYRATIRVHLRPVVRREDLAVLSRITGGVRARTRLEKMATGAHRRRSVITWRSRG